MFVACAIEATTTYISSIYRIDSISSLAINFPKHNIKGTWEDNKSTKWELEKILCTCWAIKTQELKLGRWRNFMGIRAANKSFHAGYFTATDWSREWKISYQNQAWLTRKKTGHEKENIVWVRKNLPIIATTSANMWPVANKFIPAWWKSKEHMVN